MNVQEKEVMQESKEFMHVNAVTNAIDYLETAVSFLNRSDDFKWKWIGISVYHSLYSFCILALDKGNPDWVVKKKRGDKKSDKGRFCKRGQETHWSKSRVEPVFDSGPAYRIVWEPTDDVPPSFDTPPNDFAWLDCELIGFWTALARIQDERSMVSDVVSKSVVILDEDMRAIQWLALKVRNELIHFVPKFSGISIEGIQHGCSSILTVIESLVFDSNTLWMIEEDGRVRITKALNELRKKIV
jgi:hypothetical protein